MNAFKIRHALIIPEAQYMESLPDSRTPLGPPSCPNRKPPEGGFLS
ncbi:hypothetical protein [Pseudoxanthomonas wuyuanensis]|nr:hypothetical protein [Pseudoxanthomonas wuyuanensis]